MAGMGVEVYNSLNRDAPGGDRVWNKIPAMRTQAPTSAPLPPRTYSFWAGVLSYLIPGLGQICQGRWGKGLLFLVVLYGLFFYGLYLGHWQNVYLQPSSPGRPAQGQRLWQALLDRARFLGQMWIGVAAWPAVLQSWYQSAHPQQSHPWLGRFERTPSEEELNDYLRSHDKTSDLGWICTVIAGVLNILVIYDAWAGPVFRTPPTSPAEAERSP
jgi:hypothetical protein